jgi:acetyl esterase/lipase
MNLAHRSVVVLLSCLNSTAAIVAVAQDPPKEEPSRQFRQWDKNGDGALTRDELPQQLRRNFDRVDVNADGVITPAEDLAFRRRVRVGMQRQAGQRQRPAPKMPATIKLVRDIPYAGTTSERQRLDLYLPTQRSSDQPLPVIVWIHGGAWRAGNKAGGFGQLRKYVSSGDYVGVSVGYRLTDEATWPGQIHDCKAAIRWIRGNANKYNLDPDRLGVWGSSAGGHLVAMLGTAGDVEALEGALGEHTETSSRVTCVVDYFGPSELLTMGDYPSRMDHNAPNSPESRLVGGTLQQNQDVARQASPITYVSKDDPPFLIVHGDQDMRVPYNQSQRLAERLRDAGVDTTLITITGGGHGGFASEKLTERVDKFFAKHLRGQDAQIEGGAIRRGE